MSVLDERLADGVLWLTLNRPEERHALSAKLVTALEEAVYRAATTRDARVVVLGSSGPVFSAGADLLEAKSLVTDPAAFRDWLLGWRRAFSAIEACPRPVIAAVHGTVLAGGLELVLACDCIVASDTARFGDAHIRFGLLPGGGGSQRLPEAIGTRWARWLMYTGAMIDAGQAFSLGLVQQVLPVATFADEVAELARAMALRSPAALAAMKHLTRSRLVTSDGLDLEIETAARVVSGPDAQEGLAAFESKREPAFPSLAGS